SPGGAYSVSKAGVWMLTKCLAQELATQGIRVNAIGPGFIETPMTAALRADDKRSRWAMSMTPMGRFGTPEEIASTALFLASDEPAFVTGEILHPSGGVLVGWATTERGASPREDHRRHAVRGGPGLRQELAVREGGDVRWPARLG